MNFSAHVLHLEDSDLDAEFVRSRLDAACSTLHWDRATDRRSYVERLQSRRYDLILSDYQVPGFDGFEALSLARELQPEAPFIFVSGVMGEEIAVDALKQGATDYVLKERLGRLPPAVERALNEVRERRRRRATEDALQAQEKLFRTTLASIGDGVICTDTSRRITFINAEGERLTGWNLADAEGRSIDEVFVVVHEATRGRVECPASKVLESGHVVAANQLVLISRDGVERPIDDSAAPMRDAGGATIGAVVVFHDVTQRKLNERALVESRARLDYAAQASGIGFWYCDLPFDVLIWDDRVKEHFWLPPDAHVTIDTFYQCLHPDDRERTRLTIAQAITDRQHYAIDYRTVDPTTGNVKWIRALGGTAYDAQGKPTRFDGVTVDITERKRDEQRLGRLLETEREQTRILKMMADAALTIHSAGSLESVLRVATEEARRVIGARQAVSTLSLNVDGRHMPAVVAMDENRRESPAAYLLTDNELSQSVRSTMSTLRMNRTDLRRHPVWEKLQSSGDGAAPLIGWLGAPLISHTGKYLGLLQLINPVGDEFSENDQSILAQFAHMASVALENARLYGELREEDRRKDEFLAILAHELRNPLAPVSTGLEILKVAGDGERSRGIRDMMERQLRHLVRLVDDLLDISRVSRGKVELRRENIDVKKIFDLALETSLPQIESGRHRLSVSLPDKPLFVFGDLTRLAQVMSNLLNNAAKYTAEGGRIQLAATEEADQVVVRVTDSGVGIPAEMLPKVFDLFTQVGKTLDRAQGGLGIGLSLVKQLVEMHGGSVAAESSGANTGSTFTIRLPLSKQELPAAPIELDRGGRGGANPSVDKQRVLVVDDNVDAANSLAMLLRHFDCETVVAHTGPDGLQRVEEFRPAVVFLDIGLPGFNGYEVASRIRRDSRNDAIVLVALTGWGSEDDRKRSLEAGFNHHLTKPIEARMIREVLNKKAP